MKISPKQFLERAALIKNAGVNFGSPAMLNPGVWSQEILALDDLRVSPLVDGAEKISTTNDVYRLPKALFTVNLSTDVCTDYADSEINVDKKDVTLHKYSTRLEKCVEEFGATYLNYAQKNQYPAPISQYIAKVGGAKFLQAVYTTKYKTALQTEMSADSTVVDIALSSPDVALTVANILSYMKLMKTTFAATKAYGEIGKTSISLYMNAKDKAKYEQARQTNAESTGLFVMDMNSYMDMSIKVDNTQVAENQLLLTWDGNFVVIEQTAVEDFASVRPHYEYEHELITHWALKGALTYRDGSEIVWLH